MAILNDNKGRKDNGFSYESDSGYPWERTNEAQVNDANKPVQEFAEKIYGHDLRWYLKIFGWPVFVLVSLTILLEIFGRRYFPLWPEPSINWIFFGLRSLMFLTISLTAFYKYKAILAQAIVSSVSGAFIAGMVISFFQLFWYGSLWTIINLISLPLLMIFESIVYLIIVYGIYNLSDKN